jgi:3-hydroxyacyl-CoA dehydrogenase
MARVAIVGTGLIGRAWAISYARAGHDVVMWTRNADSRAAATAYIESTLSDLAANDLLSGQTPAEVGARVETRAKLEEALEAADYVQENVPEKVEMKREVFAQLDQLAPPQAILASSTSAILPSLFTEALAGRARCVVAHPVNPPHLVPAVEIVPAPWTAAETVARMRQFLTDAGHAPIVMKREVDGFVMNRLQGALLEEAFRLVADGYAAAEDVDVGIRDGLALRWAFMGPFETIDLNAPGGVREYVERYSGNFERLRDGQHRHADWAGPVLDEIAHDRRARLPADELDGRRRWRDRRLMALVVHKQRAARDIGN